ncbi:hypothetical protein [Streptomyces sp. NPDC054804]
MWESENRVVLPEPYRSLVAETTAVSCLVGPVRGDRDPAALFPLQDTWAWEGEPLAEDHQEHGPLV